MRWRISLLSLATVAFGYVIESITAGQEVLSDALQLLDAEHGLPIPSTLEYHDSHFDEKTQRYRKLCVLHPRGLGELDDEPFKAAIGKCGNGGVIRLPGANYTIGNPLQIEMHDAILDVHGWISYSTDIDNWVAKRYKLDYQNLALAWVITGSDIVLDGNDKGGIYGNGQAWYDWARDEGNKFGRPMALAFVRAKNVVVKNWSILQQPFWSSIVIESENVWFYDYYANATNFNDDPDAKAHIHTWLQNTDGYDIFRSKNCGVVNMTYQGGDDCIAIKPNVSDLYLRNVTCYGGTGIAFGSIAQYPGIEDWIANVTIDNVNLYPSTQHVMKNGLYFKSWMGDVHGEPPNGGGGGIGFARNITINNVHMERNLRPVFIQTDVTGMNDWIGKGHDTGLFQQVHFLVPGGGRTDGEVSWYDIHMNNVSGTSDLNRVVWIDCPKHLPCHDITFDNFTMTPGKNDDPEIHFVCNNVVMEEADGLTQCHPGDNIREGWKRGNRDH